jgi:TPR repeat protein
MKILSILIVLFISKAGFAGYDNTAPEAWARDLSAQALAQQQNAYAQQQWQQQLQAEVIAEQQAELAVIYSKDTWRKIGNTTNLARGNGWLEFQGEVQESSAQGVVFKGKFGQVLTVYSDADHDLHLVQTLESNKEKLKAGGTTVTTLAQVQDTHYEQKKIYGDDVFFVDGFPYPATRGQGYDKLMALDAGYYTYTNGGGQLITVHKLVYGNPCQKIWSPEEIAAAKQKDLSKKNAGADKALKYNEDMADKGDAYGLCRMGERYRDGDGVPKDLAKAKIYFSKAANAGSQTAADELSSLTPKAVLAQ